MKPAKPLVRPLVRSISDELQLELGTDLRATEAVA
jgi:hypothetical protein